MTYSSLCFRSRHCKGKELASTSSRTLTDFFQPAMKRLKPALPASDDVDESTLSVDQKSRVEYNKLWVEKVSKTKGEKLQAVVTWRDRRATTLFLLFCGVAFLVIVNVPARAIIFIWITYYLRHPRLREIEPSVLVNFISRMPSKQTSML